jgi:formylglycine-generating enzyme required for sulfatase activity
VREREWEAYAFCIFDGGFLPTETEWEYAAAGGSEQRDYPWGWTLPGASEQYAIYDNYFSGGALSDIAVPYRDAAPPSANGLGEGIRCARVP